MNKKIFLLEIGTEELPAKKIRSISENFLERFKIELKKNNFYYKKIFLYATSCRIAIKIIKIKNKNFSISKEKALLKILIFNTIFYSIKNLPAENKMRWNKIEERKFIRPIRNLVVLINEKLIKGEIFGIKSNRNIYKNKFFSSKSFQINSAEEYPYILEKKGKVIANLFERKKITKLQIKNILKKKYKTKYSNKFLEEISSLSEWPIALLNKFNKKFLSIPNWMIINILYKKQKCIPIFDKKNNLTNKFIFLTNIKSAYSKKTFIEYKNAITYRLKDINFFLNFDNKNSLEKLLENLKKITFHNKLGSFFEKTKRIKKLTEYIALKINANLKYAKRAALLSKCELATNIISEFEDLHGYIGMQYAIRDKEKKEVAIAIQEQYLPRFSNDLLPSNDISSSLALADKIDTIVGILKTNYQTKSYEDPFYLRRMTIGIIRIIIENKYKLSLTSLIKQSINTYKNEKKHTNLLKKIKKFIIERLFFWYKEKGYKKIIIKSIIYNHKDQLTKINYLIRIISKIYQSTKFKEIKITGKRILNILKINLKKTNNIKFTKNLLIHKSEISLNNYLKIFKSKLESMLLIEKYENLIKNEFITLCNLINNFLNEVKILDKNEKLKINRLLLLNKTKNVLFKLIDLSKLI